MKMLAYVLVPILLLWYGGGMYYRSTAHECEREAEGDYIGEHCYMAFRDSSLFRLYDAKTGEKIAERMFMEIAEPRIAWGDDIVYYSPGEDKDYVPLPPTWIDRLRAKLP
ncbi:hypothetical protein BKK79_00485 [Cupriavidus sp. USMAA2-4]|uniref:DUF3304 domain-containing protein n=1 Tax=Cupriavidus malaysiensis TaxID=367825 RepID=A0ABM6F4T2_9BURK|nr:hypothetical protein BKK79_00485 [Cupriavidus sp. USMAA2-4]AOZ06469.1 hypothetical protein BKK80_12050 [Cupriavidus malaysiensis]